METVTLFFTFEFSIKILVFWRFKTSSEFGKKVAFSRGRNALKRAKEIRLLFVVLCYAGSIPGVSFEQMKLQIKLGVPHSLQHSLDVERVKSVFP